MFELMQIFVYFLEKTEDMFWIFFCFFFFQSYFLIAKFVNSCFFIKCYVYFQGSVRYKIGDFSLLLCFSRKASRISKSKNGFFSFHYTRKLKQKQTNQPKGSVVRTYFLLFYRYKNTSLLLLSFSFTFSVFGKSFTFLQINLLLKCNMSQVLLFGSDILQIPASLKVLFSLNFGTFWIIYRRFFIYR